MNGARMAIRWCVPWLVVLLLASGVGAMDRDELAKVLKAMPPNGPFWKYGNVRMPFRSKQAGMDPVIFPHWNHRARYTCRVCHLDLGFSMRQGDSGITRGQNVAGKFCGACHDGGIAFSVQDDASCDRCHLKDTTALEARFAEFSESLPMASFGNGIDWAAAIRKGLITPANTLRGTAPAIQFPDKLKKPLKLGTASLRSDVTFSHQDHFAELDCSSCHPDLFKIKQKATADFTMDSNIYGNFCGACHMLVAFPMNDCKRCHTLMANH
ncbi:MAG TPA: c(7)-type cytochrome triheme domain-containing protein [Geomonas sp.]|nr:c(7)-type cytochrome triheme domain-containing protein [Geomonas sp.]